MKKLLNILKNRYFIFGAIMVVWISFFDRYNIIRRVKDEVDLKKLEEERDYYKTKAEEAKHAKEELFSNEEKLEKFAREKYFMKKENEDVYIVE